ILHEIFKRIGIPEDRIEDYLESFGFMSEEREQARIQEALDKQNMSVEEYKEMQRQEDEYFHKHHEMFNNGDDLLKEIFKSDINRINSSLSRIAFEHGNKGFNLVHNI